MTNIVSGWKNYFFSQPIAPSKEHSLQEALRTNKWDQVDQLIQTGANPAGKNPYGHSAIDYAIWDGQTQKLPQLLGSNQNFVVSTVDPLTLKSFTTFITSQAKTKDFLNKLPVDKILETNNGQEHVEFEKLLNQFAEVKIQPNNCHFIHVLAAIAQPKLVLEALKLHPEWIKITDEQGNSILHYAAFNSDENLFVELAKQGNNLFNTNFNGLTPLTLLIDQVQKRDPLKWDPRQVLMFIISWYPTVINTLYANNMLPYAEVIIPLVNGLSSDLALCYDISRFSILLESFKSSPKQVLFTIAYLGLGMVPYANMVIKAYMTYSFIKHAYHGLQNAWQNLGHRPIRAVCISALTTSNAVDTVNAFTAGLKSLIAVAKYAPFAIKYYFSKADFEQKLEAECGILMEPIISGSWNLGGDQIVIKPNIDSSYTQDKKSFDKAIKYAQCASGQFEQSFKEDLENNPTLNDLFSSIKNLRDGIADNCHPHASNPAEFQNMLYNLLFNQTMTNEVKGELNSKLLQSRMCIEQLYKDLLIDDVTKNQEQTAQAMLACQGFTKPTSQSPTLEGRLKNLTHPDCPDAVRDLFKGLKFKGESIKAICKEALLLVHPDTHQNTDEINYNEISQKLNAACKVLKEEAKSK